MGRGQLTKRTKGETREADPPSNNHWPLPCNLQGLGAEGEGSRRILNVGRETRQMNQTNEMEFESIWMYWVEVYDFAPDAAKILALYQYCGGNAYSLVNLSGELTYTPRPEC